MLVFSTLDKHSLRKSLRKKLKGTEASSDGDLVSKDKFKVFIIKLAFLQNDE